MIVDQVGRGVLTTSLLCRLKIYILKNYVSYARDFFFSFGAQRRYVNPFSLPGTD